MGNFEWFKLKVMVKDTIIFMNLKFKFSSVKAIVVFLLKIIIIYSGAIIVFQQL